MVLDIYYIKQDHVFVNLLFYVRSLFLYQVFYLYLRLFFLNYRVEVVGFNLLFIVLIIVLLYVQHLAGSMSTVFQRVPLKYQDNMHNFYPCRRFLEWMR